MTNPVGRVNGKYATKPGAKPDAPSVTAVLQVVAKDALAPGAVKECAHFLFNHPHEAAVPDGKALSAKLIRHYKGVWDAKKERGTFVHHVNEAWVAGRDVDVPADCLPYVDALEAFWNEWEPEWLHVERTVVYDHPEVGYGGTFDGIARVGGLDTLIDLKTGSAVYPEVRWQGAAYWYAQGLAVFDEIGQFTHVEPMPNIDRFAVLHLRDDGSYSLLDVPVGKQEHDEFLALRRAWSAWQRSKKFDGKVGKPLSVPVSEGAA